MNLIRTMWLASLLVGPLTSPRTLFQSAHNAPQIPGLTYIRFSA